MARGISDGRTFPCEADSCVEPVAWPRRFCMTGANHWGMISEELQRDIFWAETPARRDDLVIEAVKRIRAVERLRIRRSVD